jgi:hypothetical protein
MNSTTKILLGAGALVALTAFTTAAIVQDKPAQPDEAAMMAKMMEYATPGKPHAMFAAAAGEWEQSYRMRWNPKEDWQETKGTGVAKTLLGGRYLMEEVNLEVMGMPMQGVSMLGYDNMKGEYISLWMDSFSTWWISARGKASADGTIELKGTMVDVAGERPYRQVIKHLPDGTVTTDMYDNIPGMGEVLVMQITAKKKAK